MEFYQKFDYEFGMQGLSYKQLLCYTPGLGNVRPAGHMRPAKHLNVAREPFVSV